MEMSSSFRVEIRQRRKVNNNIVVEIERRAVPRLCRRADCPSLPAELSLAKDERKESRRGEKGKLEFHRSETPPPNRSTLGMLPLKYQGPARWSASEEVGQP